VQGCPSDQFSDEEIGAASSASASAAANRPLNWNVPSPSTPPGEPRARPASPRGDWRLVARWPSRRTLTMPVQVPMNMSFPSTSAASGSSPGWSDVLSCPRAPERIARLQDPNVRLKMLEWSQSPGGGRVPSARRLRRLPARRRLRPRTRASGRIVRDIAREHFQSNFFGTLLDIVSRRRVRTVPGRSHRTTTRPDLLPSRYVWNDPRALIGGPTPRPPRIAWRFYTTRASPTASASTAGVTGTSGAADHECTGGSVRSARPWRVA
jgi:hypothetical protein